MKVNELGDVFCWASTATNDGSDCNGVFVYLLEKYSCWVRGGGFVFRVRCSFVSGSIIPSPYIESM